MFFTGVKNYLKGVYSPEAAERYINTMPARKVETRKSYKRHKIL
jgi:hypothetical protein